MLLKDFGGIFIERIKRSIDGLGMTMRQLTIGGKFTVKTEKGFKYFYK